MALTFRKCKPRRSAGIVLGVDDDELIPSVFARDCASRGVLADVTGRWGGLALAALHEGAFRFNALRRRVDGVSEKMLAQTLQALERDGLVLREVQATIPPRVEYSLTPLGEKVAAKFVELIELVEGELGQISVAQEAYDRTR
ncbi:HxlR family transcriptional regulator [Actinoplanes xinjiangensis]|uniref:HxlR family transcriptional regulator n=1 Tax=Actinoplanes xinjiangensis TaxID=512350 RepID=A0A316F9N1_9ACTN|nr:HxlR family transcriptional regulator [Actinoplanes xinjiangensis]GIF38291.1 HxlR family transcriptional regulator [Actinoplanes xinjiangensis]